MCNQIIITVLLCHIKILFFLLPSFGPNPLFNFVLHNRLIKSTPHIRVRPSSIPHFKKKENEGEHLKNKKRVGQKSVIR